MTEDEYVKQVEREADTYDRTIQALVCLDSALRYDDEARRYRPASDAFQGRRMTRAGGDVTPDLVVQFSDASGIVNEVKLTASTNVDFKNAEAQVRNYDDDLAGWDTPDETIDCYDVCLLVDYVASGSAREFFEAAQDTSPYDHPFILLSAVRNDMLDSFLALETRLGGFSNAMVQAKFNKGEGVLPIPLERLSKIFGYVKFYDAKPQCIEYVMDVLWSKYFTTDLPTRMIARDEKQITQKRVDPRLAAEWLRPSYGLFQGETRSPEIPQADWIREALDRFVLIGRAQHDDANGVFWVEYSSRARTANLKGFAKQVYRKHVSKKAPDATTADGQLRLPITE